jgi:hypothetical protein
MPSSKAAADESTGGVASGYVEDAFEATCLREALRRRQGTKPAAFFNSLLVGLPLPPKDPEQHRCHNNREQQLKDFSRHRYTP